MTVADALAATQASFRGKSAALQAWGCTAALKGTVSQAQE